MNELTTHYQEDCRISVGSGTRQNYTLMGQKTRLPIMESISEKFVTMKTNRFVSELYHLCKLKGTAIDIHF